MSASDSLFMLIRSMTKLEKRLFKVSLGSGKSGDSRQYIRLFDAINAQRIHDEKAIVRKFRNERYFKQLPRLKFTCAGRY